MVDVRSVKVGGVSKEGEANGVGVSCEGPLGIGPTAQRMSLCRGALMMA